MTLYQLSAEFLLTLYWQMLSDSTDSLRTDIINFVRKVETGITSSSTTAISWEASNISMVTHIYAVSKIFFSHGKDKKYGLYYCVDCTNYPNLASCNIFYLWWQEWMGSGQSLINSSTNKLLHTMVTLASRAPSHNRRHTALTIAAPSHLHSSFSMDILTHLMQFDISARHKLS